MLCFGAGKVKPEGYQNKGLQKGAVLARGILLYELSRFGRMEKITQKPRQEDAARGGRARCTSTGWPLPPALLDTDPGVGGAQGPYFVHTEVPPARRSWCFLLIPAPLGCAHPASSSPRGPEPEAGPGLGRMVLGRGRRRGPTAGFLQHQLSFGSEVAWA